MNQRDIFLAALEKADLAERAAYIDRACAGNAELLSQVEALFRAHARADASDFLAPLAALPAGLLAAPAATPRSSAPRVRMIEESPAAYRDEVAALLRQRLRGASLIFSAILLVGLLTTLSFPGFALRVGVLVVAIACHLVLRFAPELTLRQLRWIDVVMLAAFVAQVVYMPDVLMLQRAREGDFVTVVMDQYFSLGGWAVFVTVYGLVIPNPWQRAAAIILPLSCVPYVNFFLLGWYEPAVRQALNAPHHHVPVPLSLIGAAIGIYGAHTLYSIRRDVHKARLFGQYRLKEKLGSGGMGVVLRAEHQLLKRPCAIKLIRPGTDADDRAIARFEQEVQVTARLSHWNTVEIYDYGRTEDGEFYYVMELLRGLSFADLVERHGPLPAGRAVHLLRQVCAALQEAHAQGLVHRDIKPANIFAAERGGVQDVAKLLDFGLVKHRSAPGQTDPDAGFISGSPPFMSPEQAVGSAAIDGRSDLYSLGVVAYFLVTGKTPFAGTTLQEFIAAHVQQPVVPPTLLRPDVPADLEQVILRCLAKRPEGRYPDAASVERALAACACAGEWSAERAAAWWTQRQGDAPGAAVAAAVGGSHYVPPTRGDAPTVAVAPPTPSAGH